MRKIVLFAVVFMAILSVSAFDTTVFQAGIWPSKFQIVPDEINVSGLKLNLPFSRNDNLFGLDLGLASSTKKASAIQVNVLINRNHDEFSGLQVGIINQNGNASGIVGGLWNITDDKTHGIQFGLVNSSTEFRGLQVGLINYTEMMYGVQVGAINIITESMIPFFPIINFCF